jgi:hypothetical protein
MKIEWEHVYDHEKGPQTVHLTANGNIHYAISRVHFKQTSRTVEKRLDVRLALIPSTTQPCLGKYCVCLPVHLSRSRVDPCTLEDLETGMVIHIQREVPSLFWMYGFSWYSFRRHEA